MLLNQFCNNRVGLFERIAKGRQNSSFESVTQNTSEPLRRENIYELLEQQRSAVEQKVLENSERQSRVPIVGANRPSQRESGVMMRVFKDSACSVPWNSMVGLERLRWSEMCNHFVYDPKTLSHRELEALIMFREGRRPDTLYRRADGTIVTCRCKLAGKKNSAGVIAVICAMVALVIFFVATFSMGN
jgi:hypothetical protein